MALNNARGPAPSGSNTTTEAAVAMRARKRKTVDDTDRNTQLPSLELKKGSKQSEKKYESIVGKLAVNQAGLDPDSGDEAPAPISPRKSIRSLYNGNKRVSKATVIDTKRLAMERSRDNLRQDSVGILATSDEPDGTKSGPKVCGTVIRSLRDSGSITTGRAGDALGRKNSVKKINMRTGGIQGRDTSEDIKIDESGGLPNLIHKDNTGAAMIYS